MSDIEFTDQQLADNLRSIACPAGLPHTADDPAPDHGHTLCWFLHLAATRIEKLSEENEDLRIDIRGYRHDLWKS